MNIAQLPVAKRQSEFIAFSGGLDVVSPAVMVPPGFCRDALNVEEDINGGYATIRGYERYDGRTSPSSGTFSVLTYTVAGTVAVGDTITGATSGATGVVIAITASAFILTKTTGTWQSENTTAGGATVTGPATGGGITGSTAAQYTNLAADKYRSDIGAVGGASCSGSVLGVWYYKGTVYAFRNLVAGGVGMFKSSASGWQAVSLGYEISFSNANTSVGETDTLTQGGVTATINRVVVESGTLLSGINTGRLIISAPAGGNFAAGAATSTGGGSLTLSGAQTAITIPNQSGRFSFVNANFTGNARTVRMYGCDGANRPFEFDGTVFVPLNPGTGIYPKFITEHQNHLVVSYLSSVMISAIGDPYNWTTTAGAAEIAVSDEVTGFMPQPGSDTTAALAVYCRDREDVIYGTDSSTWQRIPFSNESGAIPYSVQKIGNMTLGFDDRGITTLRTAQEFGNFAEASISSRVKTWLATKRAKVASSHVYRDGQQYRMFFNDGTACYWTIDSKRAAMFPVQFSHVVTCSCSLETYGGGDELQFFGDSTGYVFQMEKGTSFDGAAIQVFMDLVLNFSKSYRVLKKYRRLTFEMIGDGYANFASTYSLSYADSDVAQPDSVSNEVSMTAPFWDEFVWDNFTWDGRSLLPLSMAITGDGENISIRISSNSDYYNRLKFSGVFLEYSPLRQLR